MLDEKTVQVLREAILAPDNVADLVKSLAGLVAIPSHAGLEQPEAAISKYLVAACQAAGLAARPRIPVGDGHYNVIAKLDSGAPGPTLVLCGHLDTVPPYDMERPFALREEAGRLYGRGTVDMKGALAAMLGALQHLQLLGLVRRGKVVLAAIADEEGASTGARGLVKAGLTADGVIIGEPSDGSISIAHRGLEWLTLTLHGKAVHGGKQAEGLSAISQAAKFITRIEAAMQARSESLRHPLAGVTTLNVGTISGGTQPSTVAGECRLQLDVRWSPLDNLAEIRQLMERILAEMRLEEPLLRSTLEVMPESVMADDFLHEALETDPAAAVVRLTEKWFATAVGLPPHISAFPAWSDGGLIGPYAQVPVVVCGPGQLSSAHTATENIPRAELATYSLLYALVAADFCS
jgi:acetylornithine deacetylase/succinyl-diaminopimelate desuccinylase